MTHSAVGAPAALLGAASGFLAGTANLVEKKGRRIELGLYVASKSLEAMVNLLLRSGFTPPPGASIAIFSASLAVGLHAFNARPLLIRRSYRSSMEMVLDNVVVEAREPAK